MALAAVIAAASCGGKKQAGRMGWRNGSKSL